MALQQGGRRILKAVGYILAIADSSTGDSGADGAIRSESGPRLPNGIDVCFENVGGAKGAESNLTQSGKGISAGRARRSHVQC
jgi:hypothetical protein